MGGPMILTTPTIQVLTHPHMPRLIPSGTLSWIGEKSVNQGPVFRIVSFLLDESGKRTFFVEESIWFFTLKCSWSKVNPMFWNIFYIIALKFLHHRSIMDQFLSFRNSPRACWLMSWEAFGLALQAVDSSTGLGLGRSIRYGKYILHRIGWENLQKTLGL